MSFRNTSTISCSCDNVLKVLILRIIRMHRVANEKLTQMCIPSRHLIQIMLVSKGRIGF
jgi:hypothetical protein